MVMTLDKDVYRLLLADDHVLICHGIKNIIGKNPRLNVVGQVTDGQELLDKLEEISVDLVILDLSMPKLSGLEAMRIIKKQYPAVKLLVLTMRKERQCLYNAMSSGAEGYVIKDDSDTELLVAIDKVLAGKKYIPASLQDDFADDIIAMYLNDGKSPFQELTRREREILQLVVSGLTSRQMAEKLNLSQRTIDHHRSNLLRKFNCKNSVDLVNYAVRNGFASLE